jgi:DNA processing protein
LLGDAENDQRVGEFLVQLVTEDADKLLEAADTQMRHAQQYGVSVLTYLDDGYPINLREGTNAPIVLFVRGKLDARDACSVAIVGTREASPEGLERARKLATKLVEHQVVIVSGLARGIDTAAHEASLSAGGRTIAVVGCGLDRTYPPENASLADDIAESGAVISQFPFGSPPAAAHFPIRNKTMAMLSLSTVVVEAGPTSGAKMQANFALRLRLPKRHVFLMQSLIAAQQPGDWAYEFLQRGAHRLEQVDDVLAVLPVQHSSSANSEYQLPLFK